MRVNFGDRPFLYGEGHAHRNAADIQKGDTAEEVAALFAELPFHDDSSDTEEGGEERATETGREERDGEETGVVVDLAQTAPQMKSMRTAIATVGERNTASGG